MLNIDAKNPDAVTCFTAKGNAHDPDVATAFTCQGNAESLLSFQFLSQSDQYQHQGLFCSAGTSKPRLAIFLGILRKLACFRWIRAIPLFRTSGTSQKQTSLSPNAQADAPPSGGRGRAQS